MKPNHIIFQQLT